MTKIVVGKTAAQSDVDAAVKIRKSIVQNWLTPIVNDGQVTNMKETLILVGAWLSNSVSKIVNDQLLHYTVKEGVQGFTDGFYDAQGRNMGRTIVAKIQNFQLVWGLGAADTSKAAGMYVGNEWWKVPAGAVIVVGAAAYFGKKK